MIETSNKVDKEEVNKENNISFSRDPTSSFPSGVWETSDKKDTSLMIESEDLPPPKPPL